MILPPTELRAEISSSWKIRTKFGCHPVTWEISQPNIIIISQRSMVFRRVPQIIYWFLLWNKYYFFLICFEYFKRFKLQNEQRKIIEEDKIKIMLRSRQI